MRSIFAIVVLGLMLQAGCASQRPAEPQEPDTIGAWIACQEFVGKRLKAPSTADFQSYDKAGVIIKSSTFFIAHVYVDTQNSFDAKLRSNCTCAIHSIPANGFGTTSPFNNQTSKGEERVLNECG